MRKFWSVSGKLVEVQRYINVPMRWCEQYPARERRELWVTTTSGHDVKLVVHSREMPARRGHQVTALLLGERMVGIYNATTEKQSNYLRTDSPLLWRRCDAAVVAALLFASALAFGISTGIASLLSLSMALLYAPLTMALRFAWRCRARAQVDRAMNIVKGREIAQPFLRRVK